ncbi:hypothetical protein LTR09_001586 [Extremus antarcticus]|uniref:Uncharacterized protein n=1 Tax=Extremus antarcticus TaxID=702011 RepID=A0AAJ0GH04_9PEZI|nr:hypothetical protein LTR09_001586 [Extremus antarcticus]
MASTNETTPERQTLDIPFDLDDARKGAVSVSVQPNTNPEHYGCHLIFPDKPKDAFAGFPVCEATVRSTGAKGYASIYGWVQMVRSSSSPLTESDKWEMDTAPVNSDSNTPFCWFGPEPSLFDCPMREGEREYEWVCHSFLTYLPDCVISKDVRPVLGFEWGFETKDGEIMLKELRELEAGDWDEKLPMLREKHSGWMFRNPVTK